MFRRVSFRRRGAIGVAVGITALASTLMVVTTAGAQPASPQHTLPQVNQSCPPPRQNVQAPPPQGQQGAEDQQNRPCPPPQGQQGQQGGQGQQQSPPLQQGQPGQSCPQFQQGQPGQPGQFGSQTQQGPQGQPGRPCPPPGQSGQQSVTIAGVAVDSTSYDPGDQVTVTFLDSSGATITGATVSCGEIRLEVSTANGWQTTGTVVACSGSSQGARVITLPPNLPVGTYRLAVHVPSAGNAQQTIYSASFVVQ